FNPSKTIMDQVVEPALVHGLMNRAAAKAKAVELFRALALPAPERIGRRYPHQLSGGQLQRLMAAMALMTDPVLTIFDEPTTALDVTTQIEALRVFKRVLRERQATAVYVSHDLAVVAQMADHVVVLKNGEIREAGTTEQILHKPQDDYTRTLMAAAGTAIARPGMAGRIAGQAAPPLLEVCGLTAGYGRRGADGLPRNVVLKDVDLTIERGATLGVIGESGSGKSTLAHVIAGLRPPARGTLSFNGAPLAPTLAARTRDQFRRLQIVFQNADTALNPAHSVARVLGRPLALYHGLSGRARAQRIGELLELVHLPGDLASRLSRDLSGGQKQRVNLARALAAEPDLILCDEITSALDTVVAAAILDLMAELRRKLNVSYMFISHDIATVRAVSDRIVVLYEGRKVEEGSSSAFAAPPFHPYTDLLIASVPQMRKGWLEESRARVAPAEVGTAHGDASLCRFLARCPVRVEGVCDKVPPPRVTLDNGNEVLCHRSGAELRRLQADAASAGAAG
ncbi:MAG: ABC transporter ATP-binding protein, partial [Alphaproteobacteria bacterium]